MKGTLFLDFVRGFLAVSMTAVVVKLMDDFLDMAPGSLKRRDLDFDYGDVPSGCLPESEESTIGGGGGRGLSALFTDKNSLPSSAFLPYSLLIFSIAASLYLSWAVTLFLASYAVGMANDPGRRLPSSMTAIQESTLAMAIGVFFFGWLEMITSLLLILVVQIVDDLMDERADLREGRWNIVRGYGRVETITLASSMLLFTLALAPLKAICVASGATFVWLIEYFFPVKVNPHAAVSAVTSAKGEREL